MTEAVGIGTVPVRSARSTSTQRRRWRGMNAAISATIGAAVVVNAIYLGATGPTVSPVTPAAAAVQVLPGAAVQPTGGTGPRVDDGGRGRPDHGARGDHGGRR